MAMRRAELHLGSPGASSEEIFHMADNRWYDDDYRRDDRRSWSERAGDEVRSWFGDDEAQRRRGNDERHDRYPYGGDRSWRDRGDASYERTSGASGWRGGRDLGGHEGSRYGSNWGESRGPNYRSDYARGDENERYGWGRGSQDYDRGSHDASRGDWGRDYSGRDEREHYGRGGQYGSSSYDRGQLRRHFSDWTPGGASGWRDWENRESSGTGYRSGSDWGSSAGWGRESYAGRGPKGYRRSDDRIREEVSDALTADPLVDASEITVHVENCHVTLIGTVAARDQKRRAEDCAERVSGVDDVTNNLRVNKQDYTKADERQDVSHIVTPPVVTPEGRNR